LAETRAGPMPVSSDLVSLREGTPNIGSAVSPGKCPGRSGAVEISSFVGKLGVSLLSNCNGLNLDLAAEGQFSCLVDRARRELSSRKQFGDQCIYLSHIRQIDKGDVDIDDILTREARRLDDPKDMIKCPLRLLAGSSRHIGAITADG